MTKTYIGTRSGLGTARVMVREEDGSTHPLDPCFDLRNHSPDGFEWGYGGSGPAQLAFAMVMDATGGCEDCASKLYQRFKTEVIAPITTNDWIMTKDQVVEKLKKLLEAIPKENNDA